ncbi:hypothetical protein Godav_012242, partial [Gossypium davidsonii]|nr:hypothetical protein [Gossypium davidsonii]
MQLEVLDEKDRDRLLGPYKKVQQWIKHTRNATSPHFDNVHNILMKVKEKLKNKPLMEANHGGARDIEKRLRMLINPRNALVVNQALKSSRCATIRSLEARAVEKNPTTIVYARCEGNAKREAGKEAQSRTGKTKPQVVNGIDYTERKVDISKREHLTPEFAEINPMKQLPAIVDGKFKLFE